MSAKTQMVGTRMYPDGVALGREAEEAAGNSNNNVNGSQLGAATTVTITATPALTPKVGGKIMASGYMSGTGTAGDVLTATLLVNGVASGSMVRKVSSGGDWNVSLDTLNSNGGAGWPSGTVVPVALQVVSGGSAVTVPAGQASITYQEVPK